MNVFDIRNIIFEVFDRGFVKTTNKGERIQQKKGDVGPKKLTVCGKKGWWIIELCTLLDIIMEENFLSSHETRDSVRE
ncbi:hypothetical protein MAR_007509 [Mya arenaria]|uniref:Uncharacterized protein n=1 Tax=Mya arenaria TaxID=6604 RepID=A0ABY7DDB2_MYAAR|nr:hypothetical protein MAR_007507 [Mya arenaria]WAQ95038.1 hypothetical protein MAR_007509 [Mya arenaria]